MPQLIAYSDIAREVERGAFRYSPNTVLAASFAPIRFLELLIGPWWHTMLFPSLIIGIIEQISDNRIGTSWTPAIVFAYLVLIMVFRPQGLLGEETREAG